MYLDIKQRDTTLKEEKFVLDVMTMCQNNMDQTTLSANSIHKMALVRIVEQTIGALIVVLRFVLNVGSMTNENLE